MINILWHKTIPSTLHIEVLSSWKQEELQTVIRQAKVAIRESQRSRTVTHRTVTRRAVMSRVDFILDLQEAVPLPDEDLQRLGDLVDQSLPLTGVVIIVSHHAYTRLTPLIGEHLAYKAAHYFKLVPTLYHAEQAIQVARMRGDEALLV